MDSQNHDLSLLKRNALQQLPQEQFTVTIFNGSAISCVLFCRTICRLFRSERKRVFSLSGQIAEIVTAKVARNHKQIPFEIALSAGIQVF